MSTLAELIEEGKRLEASGNFVELERLIVSHGPRLLAVAEAAVEAKRLIACGRYDAAEAWLEAAFDSVASEAQEP